MSELPRTLDLEMLQAIALAHQLDPQTIRATPVDGGFTGAAKFVIESTTTSHDAPPLATVRIFAKVVQVSDAIEQAVLDTEKQAYAALTQLGLAGNYFPDYVDYVETSQERALLIDYLSEVTWGGPWDQANIEKLDRSITAVHGTILAHDDKRLISQLAKRLHDRLAANSATDFDDATKDNLFDSAWHYEDGTFVNSRGETYFSTSNKAAAGEIHSAAEVYDVRANEALVLRDLNFGNLAIAPDKVMFVDPVYLDIANPASDRTVLGINILRALPHDESARTLRELVVQTFLQDKPALAHLTKYWVACAALGLPETKHQWLDFQQSCAVEALRVWAELFDK